MTIHYRTAVYYRDPRTGKEPAKEWLSSLKDLTSQAKIYARIERTEAGNFGDHKSVGRGVMELRINFGPGYRVYYALDGESIILLLAAGDKSSQNKDIAMAKAYWDLHKNEKKGV